jgi:hypothetical protein
VVVKLVDSPYRPPTFVMGAHGTYSVVEDDSAPAYLEVLLDRFLLRRLEAGQRPSPEIGRAWERLVATGGAVPIGQLAAEVGWSHKRLLVRFKQQVGLRPKTAARLVRFDRVLGRWTSAGRWTGGRLPARPAMPTRRI